MSQIQPLSPVSQRKSSSQEALQKSPPRVSPHWENCLEQEEARALVKDGTPAVGVKRSACVVKLPLMHDGKCQAAPPERHPHRAFPNGPSRGPWRPETPDALP